MAPRLRDGPPPRTTIRGCVDTPPATMSLQWCLNVHSMKGRTIISAYLIRPELDVVFEQALQLRAEVQILQISRAAGAHSRTPQRPSALTTPVLLLRQRGAQNHPHYLVSVSILLASIASVEILAMVTLILPVLIPIRL